MNTDMTWQTDSSSSDATLHLGEALGQKCRGGEIFELVSDLGGGKTTFVKGLAKGLGSTDTVTSPTFMVERVYSGRLPLHHFDFYRLGEAGIVGQEFDEVLEDLQNVVAVEWADPVRSALPPEHVTIQLERTGDDSRHLRCNYPEKLAYLFEDLA